MEINDLYRESLKKLITDAKTRKVPMKVVYAEAEITASAVSQFLSGKTQTLQLDSFTRLFKSLGVDILEFVQNGGEMSIIDDKGSIPVPRMGCVEAGRTNGFVDLEVQEGDVKDEDFPKISVSKASLRKGLRGESLRNVVALTVRGDSMEPLFQEGDTLFVKLGGAFRDLKPRDIIVVDLDAMGSYAVKWWHPDGLLLSANPKHDPIMMGKHKQAQLYGRVVGMERVF